MNLRFFNKLKIIALGMGFIVSEGAAYSAVVVGDTPIIDNPQVAAGIPSSGQSQTITVSRKQYVVSWDYIRRIPEWVAWTLNKRLLGDVSRSNVFRLDRDLDEALADENQESVAPNDYKGSCLDRGHQVPSGDRTATDLDNQATFFMSNIAPQSAYLNRRTWVSLERFLRRQVLERNASLQIYAGAIPDPKNTVIGPKDNIQVPLKNFKIAVFMPSKPSNFSVGPKDVKFFVVNFPNLTSKGTNPVQDHAQACYDSEHTVRLEETNREAYWRQHLSSLRNIEEDSGISFDFLHRAHEMTAKEVDALIAKENQNYFLQEMRSLLPTIIPASFN